LLGKTNEKQMNIFFKRASFLLVCALTISVTLLGAIANISANQLPQPIKISQQLKQDETKQNSNSQLLNSQLLNSQLLKAAQNGKLDELRSLISQPTDVLIDVNVRDEYGWTPLLSAAMNGHTDIVQILLAAGANPNTRNKYGWTPLMWAAGQGYSEIVRSLIASGARLNAQDRNGWTALMWAWDSNQEETIAILRAARN
jgi:ankyrin repeat protein